MSKRSRKETEELSDQNDAATVDRKEEEDPKEKATDADGEREKKRLCLDVKRESDIKTLRKTCCQLARMHNGNYDSIHAKDVKWKTIEEFYNDITPATLLDAAFWRRLHHLLWHKDVSYQSHFRLFDMIAPNWHNQRLEHVSLRHGKRIYRSEGATPFTLSLFVRDSKFVNAVATHYTPDFERTVCEVFLKSSSEFSPLTVLDLALEIIKDHPISVDCVSALEKLLRIYMKTSPSAESLNARFASLLIVAVRLTNPAPVLLIFKAFRPAIEGNIIDLHPKDAKNPLCVPHTTKDPLLLPLPSDNEVSSEERVGLTPLQWLEEGDPDSLPDGQYLMLRYYKKAVKTQRANLSPFIGTIITTKSLQTLCLEYI